MPQIIAREPEFDQTDQEHQEPREMPSRCEHCTGPLPTDIGRWVVCIDRRNRLAIACSQECAAGRDFPP